MTVIWLIVWLAKSNPSFDFTVHDPSPWLISLVVCLIIDIFGGSKVL